MLKKITATVAGATAFLVAVNIISKGIGFLREIIFAREFGLTEAFDLYLVSAVFPIVLNTIIFYIGQNYFIPAYNSRKNSGNDVKKVLRSNFWLFIVAGGVISLLLFVLSDPLLGMYIGESYQKNRTLIKNVYSLFLITIPFNAGISILSSYLNAEFEFRMPAYSQLVLNILIVLIVYTLSGKISIYSIPAGFLAGTMLQFLFLVIYVHYKEKISLKFSPGELSFRLLSEKFIIYVVIIEIIGQLYIVIDRWFFSSVDPGGIAALNYAGGLFNLPVSLISLSLSSVLLPYFSRDYSTKSSEQFNNQVIESIKVNNIIFVPVAMLFFYYGFDIIKFIYERGRFNASDTVLTYNILKYLAIGILFFSAYSILNKSLFASGKVLLLLLMSITGIALKIILSLVLVPDYQQDGLALSTVLVYAFFFITSLFAVFRTGRRVMSVFLHLIYYLVLAFLMIFPVQIVRSSFLPDTLAVNLVMVLLYLILYSYGVWLLETSLIRKLNPIRK